MPELSHSDDISQRRERIRSELVRANRAAIGIFFAVILLSIAIVFAAHNAQRHASDAIAAKAAAQEELWRAQLAQARATRQSVAMGRRVDAWKAVTNAASFKRDLGLRNEAIAALATPDVRQLQLPRTFELFQQVLTFEYSGERYLEAKGEVITLRRTSDSEILWTVPSENAKGWYAAAFSRRGGWLMVSHLDGTLVLWDLKNYSRAKVIPARQVWSYSISGDDEFMCLSSPDGVARLYKLPDWTETAHFAGLTQDDDLTLNEDGSRVAIRAGSKPSLTIVDWGDTTHRVSFPQTTPLFTMEWHPNGELIATAGRDQRIRIFDSKSGEELRVLSGHHSQPIQLAFVPGRSWLLSMSWDGTSRLWDTVSGEEVVRLPRYGDYVFLNATNLQFGWSYENNSVLEAFQMEPSIAVRTIPEVIGPARTRPLGCAISPDERVLATFAADAVRVLSTSDAKLVKEYRISDASDTIYTKDGRLWIAAGGKLFVANGTNDALSEIPKLRGEKFRVSDDGSVIASFAGQEIMVARPEGTVTWQASQEALETIALSGDGHWLATGTRTHIGMRVWDAVTGKLQWKSDLRQGAGVSFTPDSRSLLTATSEGCALWDAANGKKNWERPRVAESVMSIRNAVSPDGRLIAVGNTWTEAMLIDPASGAELATLKAPNPRYISALNFSGAGRYLAITYEDRSIQLWDLGRMLGELAAIGLDWNKPTAAAPIAITAAPIGSPLLLVLAAIGVFAAIAFGIGIFNRHRRLLRGYLEIEALAVQRHEQLRGAEKELARGQKMTALGTLAAGVAHDFNNLLSVIRMANTGIARTMRRAPEIAEDLHDIESAVVDGKRIVQSMLGYTRDGVGPAETFSVAPVLEETIRLLSRQFLSGLHLHLDIAPGLPDVIGYPGRLKQMLLNLIVNASEAMGGKGELWIDARAAGHISTGIVLRPSDAETFICISVRDNGPGIDRETRSRIFEPFFTTKTSATTRGTGLGLSLVYTMAEQDGLGLDCESAPGRGATFTIYFPVLASAGSGSPITSSGAKLQN